MTFRAFQKCRVSLILLIVFSGTVPEDENRTCHSVRSSGPKPQQNKELYDCPASGASLCQIDSDIPEVSL